MKHMPRLWVTCEATLQVISLSSEREAGRNYYVLDYLVIFITPIDLTTISIIFYVVKAPRHRYKHAISLFMCECIWECVWCNTTVTTLESSQDVGKACKKTSA